MQKHYDISWSGKTVGQACVTQEGLYYCFRCRCEINNKGICRLQLLHCNGTADLGILVPETHDFVLNKKLPIKQIGEGEWRFILIDPTDNDKHDFIEIRDDHPFAFLSQLQNMRFVLRDNRPGIILKDRSAAPRDSGQNP